MLMVPSAAAQTEASRDKDNGGELGPGGGMTQPPGGGMTRPPGFSAPMVVLLVALIAAFFLIGFFSVYMRRCGRGASSGGPTISASALLALSRRQEWERQQQRGLDPAVVASFPTMRFAEAKEVRVGGKDAALECAVCLSEFEDHEELRLLPTCSHAFHPDCIGEWLAGHVTCPVCRCNLDPEEVVAAESTTSSSGEVVAGEQQQSQDQAAIDVGSEHAVEEDEEERRREAMELDRIGSQRRAVRSRSGRPLPRSHSTGHSFAQRLDGDLERFTLRLPEHVRQGMVAASLRRTGRGDRAAAGARSARLGRSDRWPSFVARTFSARVPFWAASRRAPDAAEGTEGPAPAAAARSKREKPADGGAVTNSRSVRFDCLGGAVSGARVRAAAGDSEAEEDEEKAIVGRRQA
jgi:E3 ubiquitin-protein ligase ATL6/9/15/31/42/55